MKFEILLLPNVDLQKGINSHKNFTLITWILNVQPLSCITADI